MIRGYFHPRSDWPVPFVRALLWMPGHHDDWAPIEFLIDTGAGRSSLHPLDAIARVGISLQKLVDPGLWPRHETSAGVGGHALYFVTEAHYAFLRDDGEWHHMAGEIRIAQPGMTNLALPSLLGWDVLQHLRLEFDWPSRSIALD